jgi:hypothetical protein
LLIFCTDTTTPQPGSLDSEAGIFSLAFDKTGSRLISCEADKSIKIYKEDEDAVFILFYFILFYFILFYFILFYFILFYFILFYYSVLFVWRVVLIYVHLRLRKHTPLLIGARHVSRRDFKSVTCCVQCVIYPIYHHRFLSPPFPHLEI